MLSIGAVSSAAAASAYFNRDDYYTRDADSPSSWWGAGAAALGLAGAVDKDAFEKVLNGELPGVDQRVGGQSEGAAARRAGFDLTFSAPKSVSIMAEVMADTRLIAAHDAAVKATLETLQTDHAQTRLKSDGVMTVTKTGAFVAALFRHDLSRNKDPQLHTHAIVVNVTPTERGWRSLDAKPLFDTKMATGLRYRQELALRVQQLGYAIDIKPDGRFEIAGVRSETMAAFSTRRADIEAKLAQMGIAPGEANAVESAAATLATRRGKTTVDHDERRQIWRDQLADRERAGLDALRDRAMGREAQSTASHDPQARGEAATALLGEAIKALSEREAAFSKERLLAFAGKLGVGRVTDADLSRALDTALTRGDALARSVVEADRLAQIDRAKDGMTTKALQAAERAMIATEASGRDSVKRLASPQLAARIVAAAETVSARAGHTWTDDQRAATAALLTSRNTVTAVQGLAGTAKTSTVLATYATEAARLGKDVRALAPTASATETLAAALGAKGKTVDRHLIDIRMGKGGAIQNRWGRAEQVWIVDEASMLSTDKTRALFEAADKEKARIVMVGDVRQLGSVEAGAAFRQLQEAGMKTAVLEHIVRQTDPALRQAVEQAAGGQGGAALGYFSADPERVLIEKDVDARRAALAQRWLALSPAERTETILLEPSRQGRSAINDAIRAGLLAEGGLGDVALSASRLESKGLTNAEKRFAFSYETGDRVRFQRAYRIGGERLADNVHHVVVGVNQSAGVVSLRTPEGKTLDWKPTEKGAAKSEIYTHTASDLRVGDAITWTRNDTQRGLRNGQAGVISSVDPKARAAVVTFADGKSHSISTRDEDDKHWRHAYAQTAYAAQGRTARTVLIHAESNRINLINSASFYVALSRAKEAGTLVTDDIGKLGKALDGRAGRKETALDAHESRNVATTSDARGLSTGAKITEALSEAMRALRSGATLDARDASAQSRFTPRRAPLEEHGRDAGGRDADNTRTEPTREDRDRSDRARPNSLAEIQRKAEETRKLEADRTAKSPQPIRGLQR